MRAECSGLSAICVRACVFAHTHRLRFKWSEALINRREFLDTEVRKVMEKRHRTEIDAKREDELIDQWTMLQVS